MKLRMATPGPTQVPTDILLAGAKEIIHHRSPQMEELMSEINKELLVLFKTKQDVYTMLSSGTGAMEAAVSSCFDFSDKVLVVRNGYFGDRFHDICTNYNISVIDVVSEWGTSINIESIREAYKENPDIKGILIVFSETSTSATNDIKSIGELFSNTDVVVVVDAISGLISHDLKMDEWGLDVVLSASHKGFMLPPGLAFAAISEKAWKKIDSTKSVAYYFSFKRFKKFYPLAPSSAGVSLLNFLQASIKMLKEEGAEECVFRHKMLAEATQKCLVEMGFRLVVRDTKHRSNTVTAAFTPDEVDAKELINRLNEDYGLTVTGGQGVFAGKIIRVGHVGCMDAADLMAVFGCIEMALQDMNYKYSYGCSLSVISNIFRKGVRIEC